MLDAGVVFATDMPTFTSAVADTKVTTYGGLLVDVVVALDRMSTKCQNGSCDLDLDLENKVKVLTFRNFSWP